MPWIIARYQPTSLFSLKHGDATSTGAKSLLVPTPFAIRMALLDAAIRTEGIAAGQSAFERIKSLQLALRPPAHAAVTSTFVKVLKPAREDKDEKKRKNPDQKMQQTIAFREYVHLAGELALAFGGHPDALAAVEPWLRQVNYFGKRGSFYQLLAPPEQADALPAGFLHFPPAQASSGGLPRRFPLGLIQRVDEWGQALTFDAVNIYNCAQKRAQKIELGKERLRVNVILAYELIRASRGMALYRRFEAQAH